MSANESVVNHDHFIDKRRVRKAFERAAPLYDQAAILQREVCDRMLSRLEYIKYTPDVVLDAGSGTGYGTWLHGEAVGAGMVLAAKLSERMGYIGADDVDRVSRLVGRIGAPVTPPPGWAPDPQRYRPASGMR